MLLDKAIPGYTYVFFRLGCRQDHLIFFRILKDCVSLGTLKLVEHAVFIQLIKEFYDFEQIC